MKILPDTLQQKRLKNTLATLVLLSFLGVMAWLSTRYTLEADITGNTSNTLSSASIKLLRSLPDKVQITAYIKKDQPTRQQIAQLIDRYSRHKADLTLNFIDPDAEPEKTRELDIGKEGLITVDYRGRTEKIKFIDESTLTNALLQLANARERWITFLAGHGERSPEGVANFDLGQFGKELARRNIKALTLNLINIPAIPDNSALLVIAGPSAPLLAGEIEIIKRYIQGGGNLLLLTDPGNQHLAVFQQQLGVRQLPGALVDNNYALYGVNDRSFIIAAEYLEHPVTKDFKTITLYPVVAALEIDKKTDFQAKAIFSSTQQSWTEIGNITSDASFDAQSGERKGPLAFTYALTRNIDKNSQQRVIVAGDGDFLANAYIGNVGNLDMGLRMVNWLIHDDQFIDIPAKMATDKSLQLTDTWVAFIGFGFLIFLPLLLIVAGLIIWYKRKRS
ncbi:MAG: GldG family protein [Methylovulum sp.]